MKRFLMTSSPAKPSEGEGEGYLLLVGVLYLLFISVSYFLLGLGLLVVAGCATGGKAKVEKPVTETLVAATKPAPPAAPVPPPAALPPPPTGPSVVRLSDGRTGFLIKEAPGMDAQSRAEFDEAVAMIKEAKNDKAIELLEKVIARSPGLAAPHINVAIAYGQVKKPRPAEEHLKKALELIPGHPVASNEYGLLLRKAGRFAESRQVYEKSLSSFPEFHPLHKNLGILCDLYLKDAACALEHYETYGKAVPTDPRVKLWLAELHARAGR